MVITSRLSYRPWWRVVLAKTTTYLELLKFRLSLLVAFSAGFGFLLGSKGVFDSMTLLMLCLGGFLVSGCSVALNQIIERDYDKLMNRTKNRPLPSQRLTVSQAGFFALLTGVLGLWLLMEFTNMLTAFLSLVSLLSYALIYTPLKRVGPIAVLVGAFPGAFPPLLGWVAATGSLSFAGWLIFGIQFIWQFPHFWAIAWIADEDYKKAGFKLLPMNGKKDLNTAIQIMIYTLFLIPLGLLPAKFGITGINSAIIATVCGVLFLSQTFMLMRDGSRKSARKIMFSSFLYLPIIQISYLLDMQ